MNKLFEVLLMLLCLCTCALLWFSVIMAKLRLHTDVDFLTMNFNSALYLAVIMTWIAWEKWRDLLTK